MTRITVRLPDPQQLAALRQHGGGDVSYGVRRLIADHLRVGQAERSPRHFESVEAARKAALEGHRARAKRRPKKRDA